MSECWCYSFLSMTTYKSLFFFFIKSKADWNFLIITRLLEDRHCCWARKMQHMGKGDKKSSPFSFTMTKNFIKSHEKCKGFLIRTLQTFRLHLSWMVAGWSEPNWNTSASQLLLHSISSLFVRLELHSSTIVFGVFFFLFFVTYKARV